MKGKLVGYEKWESKKGQVWVSLYFAVEKPDSDTVGVIVNKYNCLPSVVPKLSKDYVGKRFMFSTSNNFLNEIEFLPGE